MREALQTYDEYINSEVDWLGKIPKSWKISHVKRFCKKVTDGAHTSPDLSSPDFPFITVVNLDRGVLDFQRCLHTAKSDYEKLVRNGCKPRKLDILYSKDGTISETVVIDKDREFVVGSSFIILRPHLSSVNSKYISYLLSSPIMKYQARLYVKGAGLTRISIFNVGKLIAVLPSLKEQETIASYLDTKTAQIDRKIDLLTQKAQRYEELKRSLINETVTGRRRIDNGELIIDNGGSEIDNGELIMENDGGENCQLSTVNYPLYKAVNYPLYKDSAIEWIGKIPEHWNIKRIKDISYINKKTLTEKTSKDYEFDYIDISSVTYGVRGFVSERMKFGNAPSRAKRVVEKGDTIISTVRTYLKAVTSFEDEISNIIVSTGFAVVSPKKFLSSKYFSYLATSKFLIDKICSLSVGVSYPATNASVIADLLCLVPPMEEQEAIADYLDTKTFQIDQIIQTIRGSIEKQKELRKTLINDVVTGKIKIIDNGE